MKNYLIELNVIQGTELPAFVMVCVDTEVDTNHLSVQCAQAFMGSDYEEDTETFEYNDGMHIINVHPTKVTEVTDEEKDLFVRLTNCRVYHNEVVGVDEDQVNLYLGK